LTSAANADEQRIDWEVEVEGINWGKAKMAIKSDTLPKKRICIVSKDYFERILVIFAFCVSHTFFGLSLFFGILLIMFYLNFKSNQFSVAPRLILSYLDSAKPSN